MIHDTLDITKYKNNPLFDYYNKDYEKYYPDLGIEGSKGKADYVTSFINKKFTSVVDLGCGPGVFLKELVKDLKIPKAVGTDISMTVLQEAQKQNPTFDFYRADSEDLPFKDKAFDVSTIIDVVEHVEHPDKLIEEAKRISNHIIFKVPIEDCWFINTYRHFVKVDWRAMMGHVNFYSIKSFKKFAESHNLKLIKYIVPKQKITPNLSWKMRLLNIGQIVTNILPEGLRVKIFPTEYYALYKVTT